MMAYNQLTLEQAEAKLIASLSNLIWIIPVMVGIEISMNRYYDSSIGISSNLISLLKTLIWVIFLLKLVNVIDNQVDKQRKFYEMKLKNNQKKEFKDR